MYLQYYKLHDNYGYVDESMAMLINNTEVTPHICVRSTHVHQKNTGSQDEIRQHGKGEKVGWIFTTSYGTVGYLQVKDGHGGRGIAKYLISAMTNRRLKQGLPCLAHVRPSNKVSTRAMYACGYYTVEGASGCWGSFYPTD